VLLVEDNPTDVFVITEVLERCGLNLQLRVASNGQDALVYLQNLARDPDTRGPSLVLLDLNMPKVTGLELLRELRQSPRFSNTPVVVVTSSTAESDRAAVRALGAQGYFEKPQDLRCYLELEKLVKRILHYEYSSEEP